MAQPTNTYSQYDAANINEDLEQVIYNIDPWDTPFVSSLPKRKVSNIRHEWVLDELAAVDTTNAQIEGDDITTFDAVISPSRVSNIAQILSKTLVVSGTNRAVDHAGYSDILAYQLTKRGRELKRDTETAFVGVNNASVLGDDTTARELGSLSSWLETNTNRDGGGTDGGYASTTGLTVAAGDSTTTRTFDEAFLVDAQQQAFESGGNPTKMFMSPYQKTVFVGFDGIAALRSNINQGSTPAQIIGNAEVYQGPFGKMEVVVDRFQRGRDVYLVDPEYVAMGQLRPMQQWSLSKTGDSDKRQMLHEVTLIVENEAAHAVIADLSTS